MKRQNRVAMFNILSTVLLNGISIITSPLFFRLLGSSGYGVLKIYNIWACVIAILFTLQTQGTLVNARVEYGEEDQKRYQSSAMSLSVLLYLICSALVLLFLQPISRLLKLEPMLIGFMLLQAFGNFCVNFLNTRNTYEFKAGQNMALSLAVTLITLVLSVILILQLPYETRYYGRAAAISLTYGAIGIPIGLWILWRGRTFFRADFWKFCVVLAIPSVFHNLSDLILGQSDQVMLQQMMGESTVGLYGIAYTFGNIMFVIFGALNRTWCPFFFEEMKLGQREAMLVKSRNFLELYTILSCGFILLTPEVFYRYGSEQAAGATMVIPWFVASYYLNFLCTFPVNFEFYHKKTKVVAAVTIGSSLVNVGLNYILIQTIGMAGAAVATTLSHSLQLTLHHRYCRKLGREAYPFPVRFWAGYGLAYGAVMALVFLTPNAWLLRWGIGACLGIWELMQLRKRKVLI